MVPPLQLAARSLASFLTLIRSPVCPPYWYAETSVAAECAGHSFSTKGKVMLDAGWKAYADGEPSQDAVHEVLRGQGPPLHLSQPVLPFGGEQGGLQGLRQNGDKGIACRTD